MVSAAGRSAKRTGEPVAKMTSCWTRLRAVWVSCSSPSSSRRLNGADFRGTDAGFVFLHRGERPGDGAVEIEL